ncbi:MAG: phosphotransferase, partial [Dehalococcoidia bacterium]
MGDWITTDMSTDRRAGVLGSMGPQILSLESKRDHPSIRRLVEGVGMDRMLQLVDDAKRLIDATREQPRGVAHNDCHSRNLFPVEEHGERITYAIDWGSPGLAPVGVDGGSLAGAAMTWGQSEADTIAKHEREVFSAYIDGLREAGWNGSETDVRLAYLSQVVTYVFFFPFIVLVTLETEHRNKEFFRSRLGVSDEVAVEQCSERLTTFIHLIDEGLALVK